MRFSCDVIKERNDYHRFLVFHALGLILIKGLIPYPIYEIHLWIANFDIRFMWWRDK